MFRIKEPWNRNIICKTINEFKLLFIESLLLFLSCWDIVLLTLPAMRVVQGYSRDS